MSKPTTSETDDIWHAETDYDIIRLVNKNRKRDQYYKLFGVLTIYQLGMDGWIDEMNECASVRVW